MDDFKNFKGSFEVEVWKSGDGKDALKIGGICSTGSLDLQKEKVIQQGLNFEYFLKHGWFNVDHGRDINDVIGYGTKATYVKKGAPLPSGKKADATGWYVEGYLLDTRKGREIYEQAHALQKTDRRLGFSIEGKIRKRRGSVIAEADVTNVAITAKPVNTDTFLDVLAKSLTAGHGNAIEAQSPGDGAALRSESLDSDYKDLAKFSSRQEFEEDRKSRGMSVSDYEGLLVRSGGNFLAIYKHALKSRSSLMSEERKEELTKANDELAEVIETGETTEAANTAAEEIISEDDDIRKAVNVTPFLKSFVERTVDAVSQQTEEIEKLQRITMAQARLVKSLTDSFLAKDDVIGGEIADVRKSLEETQKSLQELSESPVIRRGAQTATEAEELARNFAPEANKGVVADLTKGQVLSRLDNAINKAMADSDDEAIDILTGAVTAMEGRNHLPAAAVRFIS